MSCCGTHKIKKQDAVFLSRSILSAYSGLRLTFARYLLLFFVFYMYPFVGYCVEPFYFICLSLASIKQWLGPGHLCIMTNKMCAQCLV
jgi:hypothetical protein